MPCKRAHYRKPKAEEAPPAPAPISPRRGFAALDQVRLREIGRAGGRAVQQRGTAHKWTAAEAQAAGRKGGLKRRKGKASGAF